MYKRYLFDNSQEYVKCAYRWENNFHLFVNLQKGSINYTPYVFNKINKRNTCLKSILTVHDICNKLIGGQSEQMYQDEGGDS